MHVPLVTVLKFEILQHFCFASIVELRNPPDLLRLSSLSINPTDLCTLVRVKGAKRHVKHLIWEGMWSESISQQQQEGRRNLANSIDCFSMTATHSLSADIFFQFRLLFAMIFTIQLCCEGFHPERKCASLLILRLFFALSGNLS